MNLEEIKSEHDIVNVIGRSVALKKRGRLYSGVCPLHKDTDPSLKVYPERQFFKCYGCNSSGDVIDWIQMTSKVDFKGALKLLGNLPQTEVLFKSVPKKPQIKIDIKTVQYWHEKLGKKRTYFHNRGFTNNTIDRELWGYTGRRFVLTIWEGIPQESTLLAVKLRRDNELELRLLAEENKEISVSRLLKSLQLIPRYILKGSHVSILYNSHVIQNKKRVFIFFGEFDCALATQFGLPACSPVHGANSWQGQWGNTYLRHARKVIIVPDRHEREQGYIAKSLIGGHAKVFQWPIGDFSDFNEYILQGGSINHFLQMCESEI